jgi:hypothetical protein
VFAFSIPTPAEVTDLAAVLAAERCVYFADLIFREYRRHGSQAIHYVGRQYFENKDRSLISTHGARDRHYLARLAR